MERASTRPVLVPVRGGLNPAYLLIPLFIGLFLGLGLGLKDRIVGSRLDRDDSYIELAATIYGQNPSTEVAADLRQRLQGLGIANPSTAVLNLADDYAKSRDKDVQKQAEGLKLFGEALGGVTTALVKVPTAVSTAAATATPITLAVVDASKVTPSPQAAAVATPTPTAPAATPSPTPSAEPSPTATVELTPTATAKKATATPTARKTATPIQGTTINRSAVVSTGTTKNVLLRKGPSTRHDVLLTLANGTKVTVLKAVTGEVITNNSSRWYYVSYRGSSGPVVQGYIYGLLVTFTS